MSERIFVSIIISTYNNEDTLSGCIESILSQNFRDFEIIIVNNGSTDTSAAVCDSYREKDPRVKVVHMEHEASGAAYNNGLRAAAGRYVHFVEPLDNLEENVLEKITSLLRQNLDVIFLDTSFYNSASFWDISHNNILRRLSADMPDRLWDKLIRRDLLVREDIWFTEGSIWEKVDFSIKLYLHAKAYTAIDYPFYKHNPKENNHPPEEMFNMILLALAKWAGPAESTYEEHSQIIHTWMTSMFSGFLIPLYKQLPKEARKIYKTSLRDFLWLLDTRRDLQILKMLYILIGPLLTSHITAKL